MSAQPGARTRHIFHHSAGAVVVTGGRCLLLRRGREWIFPKGHLERGESARDAAMREVREETGIDVEIEQELGSTRYEFRGPRNTINRKVVDWFLAHPVGGELRHEPIFAEAVYVPLDEAIEMLTHDPDRDLARRARELSEEPGA